MTAHSGTVRDAADGEAIRILLPSVLQPLAGGEAALAAAVDGAATVGTVLDSLAAAHPVLARRLRDETGALRRFVNIYVGGREVRRLQGLQTPVYGGQELLIVQSVAGG